MKLFFLTILTLIYLNSNAQEELFISKPVASFIVSSFEGNNIKSGTITFLKESISMPDNLNISLIEDKLRKENLLLKSQEQLTNIDLTGLSSLLKDTAMYSRYLRNPARKEIIETFCTSKNIMYDILIELNCLSGGKIILCLSTSQNQYTFIFSDYTCMFYLGNSCLNDNSYLKLRELMSKLGK